MPEKQQDFRKGGHGGVPANVTNKDIDEVATGGLHRTAEITTNMDGDDVSKEMAAHPTTVKKQ